MQIFDLVGPNRAVQLFGVKLVGVNADNGAKLLFSLAFLVALIGVNFGARRLVGAVFAREQERRRFWARQAVQVASALVLIVGLASIWFDDPTRLATALGLITAGLAFALQRVVTAVAGYFVILRGNTFSVGDRIVMGGVRGDVIALSFTQTTIMEMGQPPAVQNAAPAMWVRARQYTGRVVTITNAKIFDEPIYNYSRDFPYVFEEMAVPVAFSADHRKAEQILLEVAGRHTVEESQMGREALEEMRRRYFMERPSTDPQVYWRLTDNWVELTVRFVTREHGVREVKDKMSREILHAFNEAGLGIASTTFEIVGLPDVNISVNHHRQLQ
jgi:small-conductance mechanosensitive channel